MDAVLRDAGGQIVARANHAAEYKAETGFVTINPLERIEYHLEMPVQNLAPGKPYALEGAVTGQNGLAGRTPVLPKR